ncbi:MAG: C45 family peptidase [Terriglobales bacterium]
MSHCRVLVAIFTVATAAILLLSFSATNLVQAARFIADERLANADRFERNGWIYVHLEGSPSQVGFQHGYLLAPEISDAFAAIKLRDTHETKRGWDFFRDTARQVMWPGIDSEYQVELAGIADGLKARGVPMDLWDVVALNAMEEVAEYYVPWLEHQQKGALQVSKAPGNCSGFVATGSWTKDHQVVIAHNNWTGYLDGERWRVIFDIAPISGYRILMDGFPGVITSDDDFGVNSSGLMVTETTISGFFGFDPKGKPEFMRARKAMQYSASIDEFVRIMNDGNNGGYANDWLLGDRKTGEIARFEQGLKHTRVWRTKDGYFEGSNFASDPRVLRDETNFDSDDLSLSANARRVRWRHLMHDNRGKIDVAMGQRFLADHYDSFEKRGDAPSERSLCGHIDLSPRGFKGWLEPYYPGGTAQNKVMDSDMAGNMMFTAFLGHACGRDFKAQPFLAEHGEYGWQAPVLRDLDAGGWTTFRTGDKK